MPSSPTQVDRPELLIIDTKKLRQVGITRLLDMWAGAMGLAVKGIALPDGPLDATCAPASCKMIIISVGSGSIDDAQYQTLIKSVRNLMPKTPIVFLSDKEDPEEICAAFREGAVGFMPTSIEPDVAFQALSFIKSGGSFFPPSVLSTCRPELSAKMPAHGSELTTKQEEVFQLLRQGYSNKVIARQLGMSEANVKAHARHIMHKFGVANRTRLVVAAMNQSPLSDAENGNRSAGGSNDLTDGEPYSLLVRSIGTSDKKH